MKGGFDSIEDMIEDAPVSAIVVWYLKGPHALASLFNSEQVSVISGMYNFEGWSMWYDSVLENSEA